MPELVFLVEEAAEGGFVARALGASILTEGGQSACSASATGAVAPVPKGCAPREFRKARPYKHLPMQQRVWGDDSFVGWSGLCR